MTERDLYLPDADVGQLTSHEEDLIMIARMWSGVVADSDADAYEQYMLRTGVPGYIGTPGNRGVYVLRRRTAAGCQFTMVSLWESMQDVKSFAGDDPEQAVLYPEDDRFLIERDLTVCHFEVAAHAPGLNSGRSTG